MPQELEHAGTDPSVIASPIGDLVELEAVELMLALESQDLMQCGFEESVQVYREGASGGGSSKTSGGCGCN